jgi:hypothetical protein
MESSDFCSADELLFNIVTWYVYVFLSNGVVDELTSSVFSLFVD